MRNEWCACSSLFIPFHFIPLFFTSATWSFRSLISRFSQLNKTNHAYASLLCICFNLIEQRDEWTVRPRYEMKNEERIERNETKRKHGSFVPSFSHFSWSSALFLSFSAFLACVPISHYIEKALNERKQKPTNERSECVWPVSLYFKGNWGKGRREQWEDEVK